MSPSAAARADLLRLVRDVERDRDAMSEHATRAGELASAPRLTADRGARAELALVLHHYYAAVETALSRVVRTIEGSLPGGGDWHTALVENAALPLDPLRPALISPERLPALGRLRRFRQFLRNAYAVELDPSQLAARAAEVRAAKPGLAADLDGVAAFLRALAARLEA